VENFFVVQCVKPCNRKAIDKARKNTGAVAFIHHQAAGLLDRVARRSRATRHVVKLRITKANEKRYGEVFVERNLDGDALRVPKPLLR
jgi:transketolase C-terminal domain/subunit